MHVDTSWTFAPIVIVALIAYAVVYTARWRTARREGGARAAPIGRALLWNAGVLLLAFAPHLLYSYRWSGTRLGLDSLDDQHVAGLIMALEQSIVMGIALAYLFFRMLSESEAEDQRAERYGAA